MNKREWVDIRDHVGRYQVSNDGFVRSLPDIDRRGRFMAGVVLKASPNKKGYLRVLLSGKTYRVNVLVAKAFVANPKRLPQVNHEDGNKKNNNWTNLVWCTNSYNQIHRHSVLKQPGSTLGKTGAACKNSKPVEGQRVSDGLVRQFAGCSEAARELTGVAAVSQSSISMAARGKLRSAGGWIWRYL